MELWDFHIYAPSHDLIAAANTFDDASYHQSTSKVYVSEYATRGDSGLGSLRGAVAEAVFMCGLERNGDVVQMAAYAPLFVNTNFRGWLPDAIWFDNHQSYGTPSYWNQLMWMQSFAPFAPSTSLQAVNYTLAADAASIAVSVIHGTSLHSNAAHPCTVSRPSTMRLLDSC